MTTDLFAAARLQPAALRAAHSCRCHLTTLRAGSGTALHLHLGLVSISASPAPFCRRVRIASRKARVIRRAAPSLDGTWKAFHRPFNGQLQRLELHHAPPPDCTPTNLGRPGLRPHEPHGCGWTHSWALMALNAALRLQSDLLLTIFARPQESCCCVRSRKPGIVPQCAATTRAACPHRNSHKSPPATGSTSADFHLAVYHCCTAQDVGLHRTMLYFEHRHRHQQWYL
ncbi:hypothetical protein B0T16DRAFT_193934 [Cercophora newfieldiana]|uniref:Uncharacterized protein n=1 Tax=Cercophora newfieldiana TaxID=92897 RepID=A0AA39Y3G6_9PEZI|nr:hypothetical protein B0T16DRAFT_193934 [Cercophora newfieldiana]